MNRRDVLALGGSVLNLPLLGPALAQASYPDRPIRLIVPFSPGGVTDVVGRRWAERMKSLLGTVFVENKPQGGGSMGAGEGARAQPDGHTLVFGNTSTQVLIPMVMTRPPYDGVKDFIPIYILCISPLCFVVHESVPVRTLPELVAHVKTNASKLSYGSAGVGTMTHLAGELFKQLINTPDLVHVPYKGSAPGVGDLVSGHIPMMTPNVTPQLLDFHRAGRVRILAVMTPNRIKAGPDIPTAEEAGLTGMISYLFNGLFAPAGTPQPVIEKIAQATRAAMAEEEFRRILVESGFEPLESGPEPAARMVAEEYARWAPIIKKIGFKMD
jgi:tripartite-type tricarboxylate transporter receptor subunit TctC